MTDALSVERLLGTWQLESWTVTVGDGAPRFPFGEDAFGRITYTSSGLVWATLMKRDRPAPAVAGMTAAGAEDQAAMAAGYVAYGGRFRLEGSDVVHVVEHSLFSSWVGTELRRRAKLHDPGGRSERLVLETPAETTRSGRPVHNRLTWARWRDDR